MANKQEEKEIDAGKLILGGFLLILAIVMVFSSVYTISAGQRGVLLTFGKPSMDAVGEGLHFKMPFIQKVIEMDVKTMKIEEGANSASKDLQDVQTTIALNYHLSPELTPELYQKIGLAFEDRIIRPAIQESVKATTAKFTAEELITRRTEVRDGIQMALSERLGGYYMTVDGFNIVDFQFSEEFDKAIEQKVTAEQLKLKAERDLERIKIEKEQKIAQAEAEAEALRLQKQQLTPDLVRLREIEARISAIEKWNGQLPTVTGGAVPFIGIDNFITSPTTTA